MSYIVQDHWDEEEPVNKQNETRALGVPVQIIQPVLEYRTVYE